MLNLSKRKKKPPFTITVTKKMVEFVDANRISKTGLTFGYGDGFILTEGEKGCYKGDNYVTNGLGQCARICFPDGSGCLLPVELIKELKGYAPQTDRESRIAKDKQRRDDIAQEAFLILLKKAIEKEKDIYFGDELPERLSKEAVEYANALVNKLNGL